MLNPHTTLSRLGGLAHGSVLQRCGLTRPALAKAVRRGAIERLRPGLFAAAGLDAGIRVAALHGGALTCAQALRVHGIWVLNDDDSPHVWVGRRGRIHEHSGCRCVSHYFRGEVPLGIVDVETALVQLYRCEGDESFFASLESALHLSKISRAGLLRVRAAVPASARWLVDLAHAKSESGLESLLRLRLHVLGLVLAAQVVIPGVGRVDFVIGDRLIIEVDGKQNHAGQSKRHKDLMRDAEASALGYETLRFSYAQLVHEWPTVQAAILGALTRLADAA